MVNCAPGTTFWNWQHTLSLSWESYFCNCDSAANVKPRVVELCKLVPWWLYSGWIVSSRRALISLADCWFQGEKWMDRNFWGDNLPDLGNIIRTQKLNSPSASGRAAESPRSRERTRRSRSGCRSPGSGCTSASGTEPAQVDRTLLCTFWHVRANFPRRSWENEKSRKIENIGKKSRLTCNYQNQTGAHSGSSGSACPRGCPSSGGRSGAAETSPGTTSSASGASARAFCWKNVVIEGGKTDREHSNQNFVLKSHLQKVNNKTRNKKNRYIQPVS